MNFEISTPALLFPAITLLLLAYTNRYAALAKIIRELAHIVDTHPEDDSAIIQIKGLSKRLVLVKTMQAFGVGGLISCLISMASVFASLDMLAHAFFAFSLFLMILSLASCLWEVLISGNALQVVIDRTLKRNTKAQA